MIEVIVPCYNNARFISEALDSIIAQKGNLVDKISVYDDCSTDNSVDMIKNYIENSDFHIQLTVNKTNFGLYKNFRIAHENVTSPYVALLAGDDYYIDDNKFIKQMSVLKENPDFIGCIHPVKIVDQFGNDTGVYSLHPSFTMNMPIFDPFYVLLYYDTGLPGCSFLFKTEIIQQCYHAAFDDLLIDDVATNYQLMQMGKIGYISEVMAIYRKYNTSTINSMSALIRSCAEIQTHLRVQPLLKGRLAEFHTVIIKMMFDLWKIEIAKPEYSKHLSAMIEWIYATKDQSLINLLLQTEQKR